MLNQLANGRAGKRCTMSVGLTSTWPEENELLAWGHTPCIRLIQLHPRVSAAAFRHGKPMPRLNRPPFPERDYQSFQHQHEVT
jgi:hypothetical protein